MTSCFTSGSNSASKDFPASTLASSSGDVAPIQGPTVGVVDPTGEWLLVLSRESKNLACNFERESGRCDARLLADGAGIRNAPRVSDALAVWSDSSARPGG